MVHTIDLETRKHTEFVDLLTRVAPIAAAEDEGGDFTMELFCPHTTAGLMIQENSDPGLLHDIETALDRLVPWKNGYRHLEDNAAAHIKAVLVGASVRIPVVGGRLLLGRWQTLYFCEFDGPRRRQIHVRLA